MKNPLFRAFAYTSTVALVTMASAPMAWAGQTDCPLHKRLVAQEAQLSPVVVPVSASVMTAAPVTAPTVQKLAPSIITPTNRPITPPIPSDVEPSERIGDGVIVKETQNNYGSGTSNTHVKASPHAAFTSILQKYVSGPDGQGLTHVNYERLKATPSDKAALDNYIKKLETINPDGLSRNEAIAYYANLYNAVTVQVVTDNFPLKSIRRLGPLNSGPWKKDLFTINGAPASLDTVEHKILRKKFPSPYIHYMVNCASVGCPNLPQAAWEADSLDRVRVQAARDYINSPRGVRMTSKGLKISSIFKWFKEDFGGNEQSVLKHIREHANPDLASAIDNGAKISGYDYDWSLND